MRKVNVTGVGLQGSKVACSSKLAIFNSSVLSSESLYTETFPSHSSVSSHPWFTT